MSWPVSVAVGVSLPEGVRSRELQPQLDALDAWCDRHGRYPATHSVWVNWAELPWAGSPRATMPDAWFLDALRQRGIRPVIFWQPAIGPDAAAPFADITAGVWDPYIDAFAAAAAAFGDRIIVRFAHEGNAPWFPWAIGKGGNTAATCQAAHRYVHDRVRAVAPAAAFLWCPNAHQAGYVPLADLYPGNDAVQFVGFDSYQWSGTAGKMPVELWRPTIDLLRDLSDGRRAIIVGETAVAAGGDAGFRRAWLRDGLRAAQAAWPILAGVIWFDVDMSATDRDWRIDAAPSLAKPWEALLAEPMFGGAL